MSLWGKKKEWYLPQATVLFYQGKKPIATFMAES